MIVLCQVIPLWNGELLPPGVHRGEWSEVVARFGFNTHRRGLLAGLYAVLRNLRDAGCATIWLNGSFVSARPDPDDFDMCWDPIGVDANILDPILLDVDPPRIRQKIKYGGDILPNVQEGMTGQLFVEFFQVDKTTGAPKGIVAIDLRGLP
jgi:hypothetical protein